MSERLKQNHFSVWAVLLLIVVCLLTCGCSGEAPASADVSPTSAALGDSGSSSSGSGSSAGGEVIHYTVLENYLPTMSDGWVRGEKEGATLTYYGESYSQASQSFTDKWNEDTAVDVIIQDTGGVEGAGMSTMLGSMMEIETPEGYWKSVTVKGYPGWEVYDKESDLYSQYVGVNDRFFVFVSVENGKQSHLTVFNNQINYDGLASLA